MLEKEYKYFQNNLSQLLKKYRGKYLLIVEDSLIKVFDEDLDAVKYALNHGYKLGYFMVNLCIEEKYSMLQFYDRKVRASYV